MIYRLRIILDTKNDVFRDIEIEQETSLEEFHNVITQSFGFEGNEMASFYMTDDTWKQGEEISLFNMSEGEHPVRLMSEEKLIDVVDEDSPKLLYVYDFLNMWSFFIELAEITTFESGIIYPNVIFSHGQVPDQAPNKNFISEQQPIDAFEKDGVFDFNEQEDYNEYWT